MIGVFAAIGLPMAVVLVSDMIEINSRGRK